MSTSKIKYINLSNKIYRVIHISFFTMELVAEETILSAATVPKDEVFDVMDYPGLKISFGTVTEIFYMTIFVKMWMMDLF